MGTGPTWKQRERQGASRRYVCADKPAASALPLTDVEPFNIDAANSMTDNHVEYPLKPAATDVPETTGFVGNNKRNYYIALGVVTAIPLPWVAMFDDGSLESWMTFFITTVFPYWMTAAFAIATQRPETAKRLLERCMIFGAVGATLWIYILDFVLSVPDIGINSSLYSLTRYGIPNLPSVLFSGAFTGLVFALVFHFVVKIVQKLTAKIYY